MDFYLADTRLQADDLLQDVANQQGAIPQAMAGLFPCPVKVFFWAQHWIISLCLSRSLSLMYSLLFNQVWVHTVFSSSARACPHLLTSIQSLLFTKSPGTIIIIETSQPFCQMWLLLTSKFEHLCTQTDRHAPKAPSSLISFRKSG